MKKKEGALFDQLVDQATPVTHKVRTRFNSPYLGNKGQTFKALSITVPGQAMSVQTILERHSKGLPVSVSQHAPFWDEEGIEGSGIGLKQLDLVELHELRESNKLTINEFTRVIKEENEKRLRKAKEDKYFEWKSFFEKNATKDKPDAPEAPVKSTNLS